MLFCLLSITFLLVNTCEKESYKTNLEPSSIDNIRTINDDNEGCDCDEKLLSIVSDGEQLHFDSWTDVFEVEDCLKILVADYIEAFDQTLPDISEEEYNTLTGKGELGINDEHMSDGLHFYSLVIDGVVIATNSMLKVNNK